MGLVSVPPFLPNPPTFTKLLLGFPVLYPFVTAMEVGTWTGHANLDHWVSMWPKIFMLESEDSVVIRTPMIHIKFLLHRMVTNLPCSPTQL